MNNLILNNNYFIKIAQNFRLKSKELKNYEIKNTLLSIKYLNDRCLFAREFLSPQSTIMEQIIRYDLHINKPINEVSGDGEKNGLNYEIKFSGHDKNSKFNFVQIRPTHNIDYYIFLCFNLFEGEKGKAYTIKIDSNSLYDLIVDYGGYAHGTSKEYGEITKYNIREKKCEYAIRPNPNANKSNKSYKLWEKLLKYEVEYNENNF